MQTLLLALTLFAAGALTILLPCILPLVPIVLGVSVTGRSRWRPLFVILGMIVGFVAFTFFLHFVLRQFLFAADALRIATFAVLFLFGVAFLTGNRFLRLIGAVGAALFFLDYGPVGVLIAAVPAIAAMEGAGWLAAKIQRTGAEVQYAARGLFGAESPLTALLIGFTLGLVWVPCAGPALGFAFSLVRDEPGLRAAFLLTCYAAGTAVPLLLVGYGGQWAVRSVRFLNTYTGVVKRIAGVLLILTAIALQMRTFERIQIWLLDHTPFGDLGTRLEQGLFGDVFDMSRTSSGSVSEPASPARMDLPRIIRAPALDSDGPWHGSPPLTAGDLEGKVVLIDFWTYSCINCIRTLPYIQGYWEKYKDTGKFVLIGVHTPEFAFEGVPENVAEAIERHGLTYPVVQDNDYGTWNAFANRYWPAKYLIDAEGYVRYIHFGEGAYEETDDAIATLLEEIGVTTEDEEANEVKEEDQGVRRNRTPETYLGERSWPALQNAQGDPSEDVVTYVAPQSLQLHRHALVGDWQLLDRERQVLRSATGEIRMRWQGSEINLVLGLEDPTSPDGLRRASDAEPAEAEVWIDGVMTKKFMVDRDDLFNLYDGEYGEHDLMLRLTGPGVEAYAFTFGS